MGVTGLWRLIEPAGKPVPVETLENKVLAVDISIWLHQMVKGYQDAKGAPLPNAHLMGLFQRLCKLLYFRVKPVFVFDGGFPDLKKETIAKRQDNKTKYNSESERIKRELALLLSKKTAISSLLGKQISPKKGSSGGSNKPTADDDIFKLPALPAREESESESEDEDSSSSSIIDLHSIDVESENFKKLPAKEKYDMLIELKETRKMNSWGKLHTLPKKSDNFSDFQMQRLLKRRKVQECLEETEKEMGDGGMSLNELESLLNEEGIDTKIEALPTRRIASNNTTRFVLINNVKQALENAKKKKLEENKPSEDIVNEPEKTETKLANTDELEDDLQRAIKMSLECVEDHDASASTSKDLDSSAYTSKTDDSWTSNLSDSDHSLYDSEEEDGFEQPEMSSAKAYIMQYSDFTHKAINKIVCSKNRGNRDKPKGQKVDQIIDELNKEKSIITEQVELSSGDEDSQDKSDNNVETKIELGSSDENSSDVDITTQSSVMFIENPTQEVISLDASLEDNTDEKPVNVATILNEDFNSSESDDEFEDVPEKENAASKTVVELTLNMGTKPEDDIFADVFTKIKESDLEANIDVKSEPDDSFSNPVITKILDDDESTPKITTTQNHDIKVPEIHDSNKMKSIATYLHISNINGKFLAENSNNVNLPVTGDDNLTSTHEEVNIVNKMTVQNKPQNTVVHNKDTTNIEKDTLCEDLHEITKEIEVNRIENIEIVNQAANIANNRIPPSDVPPPISTETLNSMVNEMENAEQDLLQEKGRLDRVGRNITEQMTKETQELLQIFGIPYIVAPMEAEAQCAFLEAAKLTDGTITDDSDIWLFGGKTVYKNFFNQKKHVLQFLSERIERSFSMLEFFVDLTREQLVLLALLVGSDYTTGLTGVGPVTALEILASFPYNKKKLLNESTKQGQYQEIVTGLQEFKKWVRTGKRTDNTTLKKKLKNVDVTDDFPSIRVVQAYLDPNVEKSEESFTWGEMDITILRDYTRTKFGWSQNKLDEIIKPVLKRLEDRKNQKNIHDYFKKKVEFQSLEEHMSKRVKAAVQKMGPEDLLGQEEPSDMPIPKKTARKRKPKDNTPVDDASAGPSKSKQKKTREDIVLNDLGVKVLSKVRDGKSTIEITIPKTDRVQEIIPQREKDKQSLLQNKMKAIEVFRKSKLDQKKKSTKRRVILPKDKAELSESDSD